MALVRVVRAFRLLILAAVAPLALAGCMQTAGPVAVAQPRSDLDYMAYGQPYSSVRPVVVAGDSGGGAISALRNAFASSPGPMPVAVAGDGGGGAIGALRNSFALGPAPAPAPAAYAAPIRGMVMAAPVRYDASYHLDAGDRLRVVVYGQEGLTNSYAIDASGSITMPLIGAAPARGRTTAGLAGEIAARLRNGYIREPSVAVEIESVSPILHSRRGGSPRPISLRAEHVGRERGRDRRRLLAACQA